MGCVVFYELRCIGWAGHIALELATSCFAVYKCRCIVVADYFSVATGDVLKVALSVASTLLLKLRTTSLLHLRVTYLLQLQVASLLQLRYVVYMCHIVLQLRMACLLQLGHTVVFHVRLKVLPDPLAQQVSQEKTLSRSSMTSGAGSMPAFPELRSLLGAPLPCLALGWFSDLLGGLPSLPFRL